MTVMRMVEGSRLKRNGTYEKAQEIDEADQRWVLGAEGVDLLAQYVSTD